MSWMKTLVWIAVAWTGLGGAALACVISTVEPVQVVAGPDGQAQITAKVEWEHRNCELDDDDVNIDYTGLKQISATGWEEESRGIFINHLVVELTGATDGTIHVWRECTKKGVSEERFTVSPAPPKPEDTATSEAAPVPPEQ
ncbi:MAG: hypothetical protein JXX28_00695 [Deltaproteobacteria bacterium]|nr:hypothetical protein [Deltaproteobacteria bacterium]